MRHVKTKECLKKALIFGAQMVALRATILLMVVCALIYITTTLTIVFIAEYIEQLNDESNRG